MPPPDKSNRLDPQNSKLSALLEELADDSTVRRQRGAAEIFRLGRERARRCVESWLRDPAIAALFVFDQGDYFPRTTVGVAVHPERFERICTANGSPPLASVPPDLDAQEFEVHAAGNVRLDILTTRDASANGAIARFLRKLGEGIQQVELEVYDVDTASALLRERLRIDPVYAVTRSGANGSRVNFFLVTDQNEKLLIELVESRAGI
jgi:hypothetical protein